MKTYSDKVVSQSLIDRMLEHRLKRLNAKRPRWEQIRPVGRELRQLKLALIEECLQSGLFVK